MSTTTTASPSGPRWHHRRRDVRAGWFHSHTGAAKNVAKQIERSVRRAQQLNTGEAPGVPQWLAEHLDALICGDRTSPYPLVGSAIELILERTSATMDDAELRDRILEVCRLETEYQGQLDPLQLDRRTSPHDRDTLRRIRDIAPLEAVALLELSALAGLLLRRMA